MIETALRDLKIDYNNPTIRDAITVLEKEMDELPFVRTENEIKSFLMGFSLGVQYLSKKITEIK